jgi:hypothetical protein
MAVQTRRIPAIGDLYETDPTKIADTSTFVGGVKGLVSAAAGGIANSNLATGRALRKGIGDFASIGSNADKPFMAHWDPALDPTNTAAAAAKNQTPAAVKPKPVPIVSEAQAGEIPKPVVDIGASAMLGAAGGAQPVSAALEKSVGTPPVQTQTASPTATPNKAQPIDGGSGYAVVDGKRINYRDIGGTGDPLRKSGGYVMAKSVPGIGETPADPSIGAMDREVKRIQGVQDDLNLSGIGVMSPDAARKSIMSRQGQQDLDQRGDLVSIAAQKEANDADYKNRALAINAPLIEAQAKNNLAEARAKEFAVSPAGVKQALAKEGAKDNKDAVMKYFDLFKGRSLPQQWAGKHMELAKKFAMSDDPSNDYGIFFNRDTPNRGGIGVSRKLFLPIVQEYQRKGFSEGDAMARAVGYLQSLEKTQGKLYEDIPNMDRFVHTDNKPQDVGV